MFTGNSDTGVGESYQQEGAVVMQGQGADNRLMLKTANQSHFEAARDVKAQAGRFIGGARRLLEERSLPG